MPPSSRLYVLLIREDGKIKRLGPDESSAHDRYESLSFDSRVPGGFGSCSFTLLRQSDRDWPDLDLFHTIQVRRSGGAIVWEGRILNMPRDHGTSQGIQVNAVGWSSHLKDNPGFTAVYVDTEMGHWGPPSLARQIDVANSFHNLNSTLSWEVADGNLRLQMPSTAVGSPRAQAELWYRAPAGVEIFRVEYRAQNNASFAPWEVAFYAADEPPVGQPPSARVIGPVGMDDTVRILATARPGRQAMLLVDSGGSSLTPVAGQTIVFSRLAVYGNHGLSLQPTAAGDPEGVFSSDVLIHALAQGAPRLTWDPRNTPTQHAISNLTFLDPVDLESVINRVNQFELRDWAVWEGQRFRYWEPDPDNDRVWQIRQADPGVSVDLEGDSGEDVYNGVIVRYTLPTGEARTAGPPGAQVDTASDALADTSVRNPLNSHGIDRYALLPVDQPSVERDAVRRGEIWLAQNAVPPRRGRISIQGYVGHPVMGRIPTSEVRAGDWVQVMDQRPAVARRIVNASYGHDSLTVSCDVGGQPPDLLGVLEAQIADRLK